MSGISGETVKQYLTKFPKAATRTLANIIYAENPELFKDSEAARTLVRHYRGQHGTKSREKIKDKRFFKESGGSFSKLPEGLTTLDHWGIVKIVGENRILILSDVHIPYHDKKSLGIAIQKAKEYNPTIILLNGDFADHFSISRWEKDPRQRNFPNERQIILLALEWLREEFPKARIIYKLGNHEERYENYMMLKAPELLGIPEFEFKNVFGLDNFGIELVDDMKPIKTNELFIIHGHEYRFSISNPVNPARGLYLRSKVNAICGHFHQSSSHSENDIQDKFTSCWSSGHLSDPHPKYMPLNKWNAGFIIVETSGNKLFQVHNYKIIDGLTYRS